MFLGKHGIHVKQWLPGEKTSIQIFFSSFYLPVVMSYSIDFLFRTFLIRTEIKIRTSNFLFHCYCSHSYSIVIRLLSSSQKDTSKDSYFIQSASNITSETEIQLVEEEVKKQVAGSQYEIIPLKIKQTIENYAEIHGTKAAIDRFSEIKANFSLKRTIVNAWKENFLKKGFSFISQKKSRPNLTDDERCYNRITFRTNINTSKSGSCIGADVIKANEPKILKKFGGSLELTDGWARNVYWTLCKFLEEEKLLFQCAISKFVLERDISIDLVLNLDQAPLSYVWPGKYTFDLKDSSTFPIKATDDKPQITTTFTVYASGFTYSTHHL